MKGLLINPISYTSGFDNGNVPRLRHVVTEGFERDPLLANIFAVTRKITSASERRPVIGADD